MPVSCHISISDLTLGHTMSMKLLFTAIHYGVICVLGLFVSIPIAVTTRKMGDYCLLYANGVWKEQKGDVTQQLILHKDSKLQFCYFNSYFHVAATFIFCLIMASGYTFLYVSHRKGRIKVIPKSMKITSLAINAIILLICFISAIMIVAGFNSFCSVIVSTTLTHCAQGQDKIPWDTAVRDGRSFHTSFLISMVCAWLVVGLWGIRVGIQAYPYIQRYRAKRAATMDGTRDRTVSGQSASSGEQDKKPTTESSKWGAADTKQGASKKAKDQSKPEEQIKKGVPDVKSPGPTKADKSPNATTHRTPEKNKKVKPAEPKSPGGNPFEDTETAYEGL